MSVLLNVELRITQNRGPIPGHGRRHTQKKFEKKIAKNVLR